MLNAYNTIARFYSFLSSILFGQNILKIQELLIQQLPKQGTLLILGGGNGNILPLLYKHAPSLEIEFLEASSKMITLARKQKASSQNVIFNHSEKFKTFKNTYDSIYGGFFFDLFSEKDIENIVQMLGDANTRWYVADFSLNHDTKNNYWRLCQIRMSILFFKVVAKHKLNYLPNIFKTFNLMGYKSAYLGTLGKGFYRSQIFIR